MSDESSTTVLFCVEHPFTKIIGGVWSLKHPLFLLCLAATFTILFKWIICAITTSSLCHAVIGYMLARILRTFKVEKYKFGMLWSLVVVVLGTVLIFFAFIIFINHGRSCGERIFRLDVALVARIHKLSAYFAHCLSTDVLPFLLFQQHIVAECFTVFALEISFAYLVGPMILEAASVLEVAVATFAVFMVFILGRRGALYTTAHFASVVTSVLILGIVALETVLAEIRLVIECAHRGYEVVVIIVHVDVDGVFPLLWPCIDEV